MPWFKSLKETYLGVSQALFDPSKETIHEGTTKSTCYTDLNCTRAVYIDDGVCFSHIIFTPTVKNACMEKEISVLKNTLREH